MDTHCNYWSRLRRAAYRSMLCRHTGLWQCVRDFIRERHIQSILEIGGGMYPPASSWVPTYWNVDINPRCHGLNVDFTQVDVRTLPRADLLLACNVIEHCAGYEGFLSQVVRYNAPFAIVSFFLMRNPHRRVNLIRYGRRKKLYVNKYSPFLITQWLKVHEVDFQWTAIHRHEMILLIKKSNEAISHTWASA